MPFKQKIKIPGSLDVARDFLLAFIISCRVQAIIRATAIIKKRFENYE
jgi:hypothetical protein